MTRKVLIVDDDRAVRDALEQTLGLEELEPVSAGSFIEAKDHISRGFEGVVLSDIRMPGRDGFHLLDYAQSVDTELPVILLTGEGDIPMAVKAMGQGAFDFLEKPSTPEGLVGVLRRALLTRSLVLENRRLKSKMEAGDAAARMIFGTSKLSDALRARVRAVANTQIEALVTGPRGAGISKVAEVIHLSSSLQAGPFVRKQSAGLDPAAFGEAAETAAGGSLFLDEVETLTPALQYELAERLDAGLGTRLIAGSTADLSQAVDAGAFNAELYYRLEGMRVHIPALSERPEDIPVLFRHYVAQAAEQAGIEPPDVTEQLVSALIAQDWPGNARSLMSAAMRFVLGMPDDAQAAAELGLAEQMARVERSLLVAALGRQNGKASAAAQALKLPRKTFYDKLARYGVKPEDYRR